MKLLIVESPKKAKEIQHFLQQDGFVVKATLGHFKDLPENEIGVDLQTYQPRFVITDTKHRQVFQEILQLAEKSQEIYIATDPDREGYAIGYMMWEELKRKVKSKIFRVEFREITKQHILDQLKNPVLFEKTNTGLFNAFLGRRIGDRIVGYLLSPKHSRMNNASLSVGRVQSPAVRLVVDREIQIQNFKPTPYYVLSALLEKDGIKFTAIYEKPKIEDKETAENIYQDIKDEKQAKVEKVEKKQIKQSPKPPFTTSTLQQSANSVLSLSPEKTMNLAQELFESGLITYHRTDSTRLSEQAVMQLRNLIQTEFGQEYLPKTARTYKSKTQADAHEAIRITNFVNLEEQRRLIQEKGLTEDHFKLLKLIYERTVACQMEDAVFDKTDILLLIKGYKFKASGSVLKFKGWKVIFDENTEQQAGSETGSEEDNEEKQNQKLPMLSTGDIINIEKVNNIQKFTKPPDRYTEGSLVRKLEELGIGRPSTYAGIMKTIKDRGYIKVEKGKVIPTEKGFLLIQSLNSNGDSYIIDYNFTKEMEEFLDKVEENKEDWKKFVSELFAKINFIPEKREVKPPSEKQVEFAKKLAEKHSVEIPEKALQSSFEMKKFIDGLLQKKPQKDSVKTSRKDKKTPDSIRRR